MMNQLEGRQISKSELIEKYLSVRAFSEQLCEPLEIEDYMIQSMPDASPTRWHLAHTTWFFETFLLRPELKNYKSPNDLYNYLFNSYYNAIGEQYPRPKRGLLSRPTVAQVYNYRHHVNQEMLRFFESLDQQQLIKFAPFIELGINHEQQHQELMLTDLKHALFQNPLFPAYTSTSNPKGTPPATSLNYLSFAGGLIDIGFEGPGFSFDNETPRHKAFTPDFQIANRLITNGEYLAFMNDGGYGQSHLWLSDGWALITLDNWQAPLYWVQQDEDWFEFTLAGLLPLDLNTPVTHLSHYEADAYANWANARLPSEFEWEIAARQLAVEGNFVESGTFHPKSITDGSEDSLQQLFGDVWE